ncbi:hypothetical protein DSO57_1027625 [Entomophthora muscae]|uniref:Uncharacterized protein n=1 Tax=Entomophthora muscae TaxID=34485 RepID=A0ACC2TNN8_9FUNG|nr:hypothetical protein DSO57_1027625 [Entomophthora muscae]
MLQDITKPTFVNGALSPIASASPNKHTEMMVSHSLDMRLPAKPCPKPSALASRVSVHRPSHSLPATPIMSPELTYAPDLPEEREITTPTSASPKATLFPFPILTFGPPLFEVNGYQAVKQLGTGAFSEVYLAFSPHPVALKMIPKTKLTLEMFEHEVEVMNLLKHPNIVELLDHFITEDHYVLVQEYVPDGELFSLAADRTQLSSDTILQLFRQCTEAIAYMHEQGFAHRDIKLENFLVDRSTLTYGVPTIKLCDFGFATRCELTTRDVDKCGSDEYIAPEHIVLSERGHDLRSGDIWSLGIILYALLVGHLPFTYDTPQTRLRMFQRIATGDIKFPDQDTPGARLLSQDLKRMVLGLLKQNPRQRTPLTSIFPQETE